MMKKILTICFVLATFIGCNDPYEGTTFVQTEVVPTGAYLETRPDDFSEWITVLRYADLFNAINESGKTYTVFAPSNAAVKEFYKSKNVGSIQDLGADYAKELVRNHLISTQITQKVFLLGGRLTYPALSEDYLTVSFGEAGSSEAVLLNGTAPVKEMAIATTNGLVYVLDGVLNPITETLYDRIGQADYSIFKAAIDATGWDKRLNTVYDTLQLEYGMESVIRRKFTLLAVSDKVFAEAGVKSLSDLATLVDAGNDYTSAANALNQYVAYHMISSACFAEDFFKFTPTDSISIWSTQAANQVISSTNVNGVDYFNYRATATDTLGVQLVDKEVYELAKNGVIHEVDGIMPLFSPDAVTVKWDFCDYPELESIINNWGASKGYGECYQHYLFEQKGKLFDVDITGYGLDFFTYSAKNCNYNWSKVGYAVLGNLKDNYEVNYFGSSNGSGQAYKDDVLILNLGYMGKFTIKSPTILKGRYKVTLGYGYDQGTYSFFNKGATKCKFTLGDNVVETNIYDTNINTNNSIEKKTLWTAVEFKETGTLEFNLVVQDPRASNYNQFRIFLDYLQFDPIN